MREQEFNETKWKKHMKILINAKVCEIAGIDFGYCKIGVIVDNRMYWYPIEMCELIGGKE